MGHFNQYNATPVLRTDRQSVTQQETDAVGNQKSTVATQLSDVNHSITTYPKCLYANITASGLIKTGTGFAYGVVINSHTSGTLKLWDATTATTPVLCETITFAVGERFIPLNGATFNNGLFATIGGTANITILFR